MDHGDYWVGQAQHQPEQHAASIPKNNNNNQCAPARV
jgi:hypothetical protein